MRGRRAARAADKDAWTLDVTDAASIAALAERLAREGVRLDVLVNNAGISLKGFDAEVVRRTLAVNFFGAIAVTDAVLPSVRDGGAIVMVSSGMGELSAFSPALRARFLDAGLTRAALIDLVRSFEHAVERGRHVAEGWPSSAYRVSKASLNAWVRLLARELAPRRIRVNAVCPGWVRTDMGGDAAPLRRGRRRVDRLGGDARRRRRPADRRLLPRRPRDRLVTRRLMGRPWGASSVRHARRGPAVLGKSRCWAVRALVRRLL